MYEADCSGSGDSLWIPACAVGGPPSIPILVHMALSLACFLLTHPRQKLLTI